MNYLNRKGYTLSQFILVWILGAIFVIFMFLTVSRYRATAQAKEAEEFLQAVRIEQEDRCAVGRKYAVYANHLKTFYKQKKTLKSISYDLSSGSGIAARNKLYGYRISMPSYADGRICCDDCEKLDRYYSPCDVLTKRKDFIEADPDCTVYVKSKGKKAGRSKIRSARENSPQVTEQPAAAQQTLVQPVEKTMQPTESVSSQPSQEPAISPEVVASEDTAAAQQTAVTPTAEVTQAEDAPKPTVSTCPVPESGDFYIDSCEVYRKGTQGAVMHTWNSETCAYEVVQNCMVPAHWQTIKSSKSEHGLYPSDLDNYCTRLMQGKPCETTVSAGEECFAADETCYKSCQFMERTRVEEAANIILYDVEVQIEQLHCAAAKTVTVTVP
ncbi:MAG: hypothetical protein IJ876_03905 [Elusimicrobiaceae bacterium]|nr:hypothetical protein [Elusimicrobiaceae bacterium]